MNTECITGFEDYLKRINRPSIQDVVLFRGQHGKKNLLPRVVRKDPTCNTVRDEMHMLAELRRHASIYGPDIAQMDDWDLLVYAQHFGMSTRLLDWTQNPLVGLWFACANEDAESSSYVYVFEPPKDAFIGEQRQEAGPFKQGRTRVLKPNLNNARIVAQEGWFTVHRYATQLKRFVPLDQNIKLAPYISCFEVQGTMKTEFLRRLSILGVNHRTVFPDIGGMCNHLNWIYQH